MLYFKNWVVWLLYLLCIHCWIYHWQRSSPILYRMCVEYGHSFIWLKSLLRCLKAFQLHEIHLLIIGLISWVIRVLFRKSLPIPISWHELPTLSSRSFNLVEVLNLLKFSIVQHWEVKNLVSFFYMKIVSFPSTVGSGEKSPHCINMKAPISNTHEKATCGIACL